MDEEKLLQWFNLGNFQITEHLSVLLRLRHKIIAIFSGNQGGKTSNIAVQYLLRALGKHPVEEKNQLCRKIRCISSTLPSTDAAEEQDNAQYLELKKIIPPSMILKDITARAQNLVIKSHIKGGKTVFEFRSSKQELQDLGKIQLSSVWHDEETPERIRDECRMRLLAEGGDELFSLTPVNYMSYCFEKIWERKSFLFRTKTISQKFNQPQIEYFPGDDKIACIMMATDDNPILTPQNIEDILSEVTDPDEYMIRRYGIFKHISGRVHKTYNPNICYINFQKTFPNGIPYEWTHARAIDYHESRTPWSIGWLAVSPEDEWFVWQEFHPAIDGPHAYTSYEIAQAMVRKSHDYEYIVNLIDPLAAKKQPNTLFSVKDDLTRYFHELRAGCRWDSWDTKDTIGREEVRKRFKNAARCGKPFNNVIKEKGVITHLPTLWICDTCPNFHRSVMNWRYKEWATVQTQAVNDPNSGPQQRYSHDNMVLECLAKDSRVLHAAHFSRNRPPMQTHKRHSITGG